MHVDNKGPKQGPKQELDDTVLSAEAQCPIDFNQSGKRFVLSLQDNGSNGFLFVKACK